MDDINYVDGKLNIFYANVRQSKDRTLMHSNSHAKLLTVLTIDLHTAPGIVLHALKDTHGPLIHTQVPHGPQQDLSWHTTEGFLEVDEGKIEPFVGSGDVDWLYIWHLFNVS